MIVHGISMKMKTSVILLSFLSHWIIVSTEFPPSTSKDSILKQRYLETWLKDLNIPDYGGASAERSLGDGQERSRATQAGLNQRETRSVQKASSGTDWGGTRPRGTARQEQLEKKRNIPPLITMLNPRVKVSDSAGRKSKLPARARRSTQDPSYLANVVRIEGPTDEVDIHRILATAKAKLSSVKSDNMGTFRDNAFGDDWLMFVLPFNSGIYTQSLLSMGNDDKTKTRTEQSYDSIGEISTAQSKLFENSRYQDIVDTSERNENLKKYDSSFSRWNGGLGAEYLNELNMETTLSETGYEISKEEENNVGKNENSKKSHLNRNSAKNERYVQTEDNKNERQDYTDVNANGGGKDKEILFTTDNVVGSDKPSTAELPVLIPATRDQADKNKRPSNDESRFIVDPYALLASLEGDTRPVKKSKSSIGYETDEYLQGGKLTSGQINTASFRGEKFQNSRSDSNKYTDTADNKGGQRYREKLLGKKGQKINVDPREDENSEESSLRKIYSKIWDESSYKNVASNAYRVGESTGIAAREYLAEKHDKKKSAAETSDRANANERGRAKHSGRVEGKSTFAEVTQSEREHGEKKHVNRESLPIEAKVGHNSLARDRHDHSVGSQANIKREWKTMKDNLQRRTDDAGDAGTRKYLVEETKSAAARGESEEKNVVEEKDSIGKNFGEKEKFDGGNLKKIKYTGRDGDGRVERVGRLNGYKVELGNVGEKLGAEHRDVAEWKAKNVAARKFELENGDKEKFGAQIETREEAESGNLKGMKFGAGNRKVSTEFGVDRAEDWKFKLVNARKNKFESGNGKRDKFETKREEEGWSEAGVSGKRRIGTKDVQGGEFASKTVERKKLESKELARNVASERVGNAKFKADNLGRGQVGVKDSGQRRYDMRNLDGRKFGLTKLKEETSSLRDIQDFTSRGRDERLLSSGRVIVGNNEKFGQINLQSLYGNNNKNSGYNRASFVGDEEEMRENHGYTEEDRKEREKYGKYAADQSGEKITKVESEKKLGGHLFNSGTMHTQKDLHVAGNNAFEILDGRSKSLKGGGKEASYEGSLNQVKEYSVFKGKDQEDRKLISSGKLMNKNLSPDQPHESNSNLKEDNVEISAIKDEAGKRKGTRLPSDKEKLHETIETDEDEDKELLRKTKLLEKSRSKLEENKSLVNEDSKLTTQKDYLTPRVKHVTDAKPPENIEILKENKSVEQSKSHGKRAKEHTFYKSSSKSEKSSKSRETSAVKSEQYSKENENTSQLANSLKKTSAVLRENETSQEILPDDLHVNRAKKLSGVTSARTGGLLGPEGSDESSAASAEARVAGLEDENKAFRSREDDISEVQSATSKRGNSGTSATANRVDDRKKVKISRSRADLDELSDTDTRKSEYSDKVIENQNTSVGAGESRKEDHKTDLIRFMGGKKSSNVDAAGKFEKKKNLHQNRKDDSTSNYAGKVIKSVANARETDRNEGISQTREWTRTAAEKNEKFKTQTANEVYNALETLNAEDVQTIAIPVESGRGEPKEVLSGKGTKDTESVVHNLIEKGNSKLDFANSKHTHSENIDNLFDKSKDNSRGKLFKKVKEDEGMEQKLRINHLTESLTENKGLRLINQHGNKIVANDVNSEQASDSSSASGSKFSGNSDSSWERNKSSVAINQVPGEESAEEKTTESNVVEDHSSKQHDFKVISNLSLESRRNETKGAEKDETNTINDERYKIELKNKNFESSNSNVVNSSESLTKKLSKSIDDNYKADELRKHKEHGGIRKSDKSISSMDTADKINENNIKRGRYQISTEQKSGVDDVHIRRQEQGASTKESESIERDLNKEGFQRRSNTSVEVDKSNDSGGRRDESSSTLLALKATKKESSFNSSGESSRKNDKLRMKKVNVHDRSGLDQAGSKEHEITKSNMEEGAENETPSAAWQLIEDNGLEAHSGAGVPTVLNTKTTNEARSSGKDENPIIRRLTEGSVTHQINWADNERYKEPSTEAGRAREKTLANVDANSFTEARLSRVKFGAGYGSIKLPVEEVKSEIREATDVDEEKHIGESDEVELKGDHVKGGKSGNLFEKYNDTAVGSDMEYVWKMARDDFTRNALDTSHVAVSLNESDYEAGNESDKLADVDVGRQIELADTSRKNHALDERENGGTKGGDTVNGGGRNSKENERSKTWKIVHLEDDGSLLKNTASAENSGSYEEKNNAVPFRGVKVKKQRSNDLFVENVESSEDKSAFGKKDKGLKTGMSNAFEKQLHEKTSKRKSNREYESSANDGSYDSVKYGTSESTENIHGISDGKVETQIRKPLTGTKLAITLQPWLKQQQDGNILRKTGKLVTEGDEKYASNENQSRETTTDINMERKVEAGNKLIKTSNRLSSSLNTDSSDDRDISLKRQKSNVTKDEKRFDVDSQVEYKHHEVNSDTLNGIESDSLKENIKEDTVSSRSEKHENEQKLAEKVIELKHQRQQLPAFKRKHQHLSRAPLKKYSKTDTNEPNVLSNSLQSQSSDYIYPLDKNEKSTESTSLLSDIPPTISFGEGIANAKFVKKLQPSSSKFTETLSKVASEGEAYVDASSKSLKMHPDEKEAVKPVKSTTCTSLSEVLGTRAMNDDLCTILGSIFLFTQCREDTKGGGVPSTYGVSTDARASKVVSEEGESDAEALESDSIHELPRMPQEPGDKTVDVYIVKRTSEGRVKTVHMENVVPLF